MKFRNWRVSVATFGAMVSLYAANPALAGSCDGMVGEDGKPLTGAACREYVVVQRKLDRAMTDMTVIETALQMYYRLEGVFPGNAETLVQGVTGDTRPDSTWYALGFTSYPTFSAGIASVNYVPFKVHPPTAAGGIGTAESFALIVTLNNIKPDTIDGQLVGVSPSPGFVIAGTNAATAEGGAIQGETKAKWTYTCHRMANRAVDPLVRNFFNNSGVAIECK